MSDLPRHRLPASGENLLLSELFVSLQGEGVSTGIPAAFVRLGNCNLTCSYCDTAYTWDDSRFDLHEELRAVSVDDVAAWIAEHAPGRVILTGGEPLLQQKKLERLVVAADALTLSPVFFEVETNGTVAPSSALLGRINQWNVSPKLSSSGEPEEKRLIAGALEKFAALAHASFKFVVGEEQELAELDEVIRKFHLPRDRVLLMPEARTKEQLRGRGPQVAAWASRERYRYSNRLHLELYDGRRGT